MTAHPATLNRARVEANLKARMEQYVEAKVMYRSGALTKEALARTEEFVEQELQRYREACYAELDDEHGLGKAGLDAARELLDDAVWYPLQQLSAGGRQKEAWLVDDEKMEALAEATGVEWGPSRRSNEPLPRAASASPAPAVSQADPVSPPENTDRTRAAAQDDPRGERDR